MDPQEVQKNRVLPSSVHVTVIALILSSTVSASDYSAEDDFTAIRTPQHSLQSVGFCVFTTG